MESREFYVDKTPAANLDKKTLNKMAWRSCFLQASFNYERMQAAGWLYGILPGLEKIHTNKEDLSTSMNHNLEFFNTHPFLVTFVMGIVLSLEQQKADVNTIRSVRVAAMGPLGGIGDAIFWLTLVPIAASIGSNMSLQKSVAGPIIFLVMFNVVQFVLRYWLMHWSYKMGTNAVTIMTSKAKEFTRAATILGVFVVGALVASIGGVKVGLVFPTSDISALYLDDIIGTIMPRLLPLLITFLLYWLIKKMNWTTVKCIILLIVIGVAGAASGVLIPVDSSKVDDAKAEYAERSAIVQTSTDYFDKDIDDEVDGTQTQYAKDLADIADAKAIDATLVSTFEANAKVLDEEVHKDTQTRNYDKVKAAKEATDDALATAKAAIAFKGTQDIVNK